MRGGWQRAILCAWGCLGGRVFGCREPWSCGVVVVVMVVLGGMGSCCWVREYALQIGFVTKTRAKS